jgi:Zn-dependent M28 family amino/carboxypeptidase
MLGRLEQVRCITMLLLLLLLLLLTNTSAVDPNSGTAAMMEIGRAFGQMLKQGWKPRRTITLCSWDGEEYGLLGSTAYALNNKQDLQANAVAYINVDVCVSGPPFSLGIAASPSLNDIIRSATRNVTDPASGKLLFDVWNKYIGVLGSGSDYTALLDNVGVPSANLEFNGDYGVYHSVYDSFHWMVLSTDTL